jgi:[ribosomal protein S18]-alanine N-acetyltransferase
VPRAIRVACPADAEWLAAIDADVSFNPWTEQQFALVCSATAGYREIALVVEEDDSVYGFVVFSQVLDEGSIHNIAVHRAQHRRGLGLLLLEAAVVELIRADARRCLLEVRRSNKAARRLYQSNGFALDGVRKNYYPTQGGREDALLMSREL